MIPVPVIMPCLNRFDMLTQAWLSIDTPVIPYIIDQWNNNRGVSGAWNLGMQRAMADGHRYALVSNDDVIFSNNSINQMRESIEETGAPIMSANQNGNVPYGDPVDNYDAFCFMVNMPLLVNSVGWFDQNFFPAYFEDNDMHRRMRLAGLTAMVDPKAVVMHVGSATQNFDKDKPNVPGHRFEGLKYYYVRKWGGEPSCERYDTPFGDSALTIRDWNGSYLLDDEEEPTGSQLILDKIDSKAYDLSYDTY